MPGSRRSHPDPGPKLLPDLKVRPTPTRSGLRSLRFAAELLARAFTRERLLGAAAIPWFQVEGMLLDILDDIFLLYLPLEPAQRALDGFAILHFHFSQATKHPLYVRSSTGPRGARVPSGGPFDSVGIR